MQMRAFRFAAAIVTVAVLLPAAALGGAVTQAILKCKQAKEAYDKGQVEEAIRLYTEAIELNPKYTDAYFQRSAMYRERGQWDKELEDLNSTLACDKNHVGALRRRAERYFYAGQYLDAELDYDAVIKLEREGWYNYYMRGRARAAQGHNEGAIKDFTRAIEEGYGSSDAYYERGKIWIQMGKPRQAEADFKRAIENYVQHVGAYLELGKLRLEEGKYDEALKLFTSADRYSYGKSGEPLFWRANTYKAMKEYARAVEDYAGALDHQFDTPQLRYNRAAVFYELGELEKALEDLKVAVEKDKENEQFAWALERVEQMLAKKKAAEAAAAGKAEEGTTQEPATTEPGDQSGEQPGSGSDEQEKGDDEFINPL
jgi:tetratricopeptide (TPR) repeat protein